MQVYMQVKLNLNATENELKSNKHPRKSILILIARISYFEEYHYWYSNIEKLV